MGQGVSGYKLKTMGGKSYRINTTTSHSILPTGMPNSVTQKLDKDGNLEKERYYDENGHATIDIDYTDHGNPKLHPKVPHIHKWDWSDPNNPKRSSYDD